jgi:hypothetical protein
MTSSAIRVMLKSFGVLYGINGFVSFVMLISGFIYMGLNPGMISINFSSVFVFGFVLLDGILSFLIMYSFWKFQYWGRPLAIGFNIFWMGLVAIGYEGAQQAGVRSFPLEITLVLRFIFVLVVTFALFRSDVKGLMQKGETKNGA